VVGLDLVPRLLAVVQQLTAQHGRAIEIVAADATDTKLSANSFDLVHERTLLNVTNPGAVVAEMMRLARSGDIVALQEPDSSKLGLRSAAAGVGAAAR